MTLQADRLEKVAVGPVVLAEALGIQRQTVASLAKAGVLVKTARGQYPLLENVRRYVSYRAQGDTADTWREARTRHLEVRTERERLALVRDKLKTATHDFDAGLDGKFWELLVAHVSFADAAMFELERAGLIADVRDARMRVANTIQDFVIRARVDVRDRLQEYRRTRASELAETLDGELGELEEGRAENAG